VELTSELIPEPRQSALRARKLLKSNNKIRHIQEDTRSHRFIASAIKNDKRDSGTRWTYDDYHVRPLRPSASGSDAVYA
jgi:hypothetical protein